MDNNAVFDKVGKCKVLQDVFFGGKHLEKEEFDSKWKAEVETKLQQIAEEGDQRGTEQLQYLNRDITESETEAALQSLKKGKTPGCDLVYTDLLIAAGPELTDAIHTLFYKS